MSKTAATTISPLVLRLRGDWRCADGFSDVTISITGDATQLDVQVFDDEERAEIFAVEAGEDRLRFAAHWQSNGRLIKYDLMALPDSAIDVRFTYSGQETWLRHHG